VGRFIEGKKYQTATAGIGPTSFMNVQENNRQSKSLFNGMIHVTNTQTNQDRNITWLAELMIINRFSTTNVSGYYMYVPYKVGAPKTEPLYYCCNFVCCQLTFVAFCTLYTAGN